MNAADNTGAETTVQPGQETKNLRTISEENIEQATQLVFFLHSVSDDAEVEDTLLALRKNGLNAERIISTTSSLKNTRWTDSFRNSSMQ